MKETAIEAQRLRDIYVVLERELRVSFARLRLNTNQQEFKRLYEWEIHLYIENIRLSSSSIQLMLITKVV